MKMLLMFLLLLPFFPLYAQNMKEYYVTIKGDTVLLGNYAYIDLHSHPQLLWVKDSTGKRKVILPDSVVYLQQERSYLTGKFRSVTVMDTFRMLDIPIKNGRFCRHYTSEIFRHGQSAVVVSPFCNDCNVLTLWVTNNGKYVATLGKKNFSEIMNQYFTTCPELVQYAKTKKYGAYRFSRYLQNKIKKAD